MIGRQCAAAGVRYPSDARHTNVKVRFAEAHGRFFMAIRPHRDR